MNTWRYIDTGPLSAAMNMAVDEALASSVLSGISPPVLRFYSWETSSVSIGYFQKWSSINTAFCVKERIPVVRRLTGGRAILHGEEVTYSFSAGARHHSSFRTLNDSYEVLSRSFLSAFVKLGMDVHVRKRQQKGKTLVRSPHCFEAVSFGEIVHKGKKIIGSAQRRMRDGFLQQGSIPFAVDGDLLRKIFESCAGPVNGMDALAVLSERERLHEKILEGFQDTFNITMAEDRLTRQETREAERLQKEKYSSVRWLERR